MGNDSFPASRRRSYHQLGQTWAVNCLAASLGRTPPDVDTHTEDRGIPYNSQGTPTQVSLHSHTQGAQYTVCGSTYIQGIRIYNMRHGLVVQIEGECVFGKHVQPSASIPEMKLQFSINQENTNTNSHKHLVDIAYVHLITPLRTLKVTSAKSILHMHPK